MFLSAMFCAGFVQLTFFLDESNSTLILWMQLYVLNKIIDLVAPLLAGGKPSLVDFASCIGLFLQWIAMDMILISCLMYLLEACFDQLEESGEICELLCVIRCWAMVLIYKKWRWKG